MTDTSDRKTPHAEEATDYEAVFLEQLDYIEDVIAFITRRHALRHQDAQDFSGWVMVRLIQDDYRVLRKFKGNSKLSTFLTTVIHNQYRDFRIHNWGKWRASAAAVRLGEVAVQLESLLYRDHYSLEEATKILRENYDVTETSAELEDFAAQLRRRYPRRFETENALIHAMAPEQTERDLLDREHTAIWSYVYCQVRDAMEALDAEDRLILRMRFEDGLTVAAIARELELDQRRLYSRLSRLLRELRKTLDTSSDSLSTPPPAPRLAGASA